MTEAWMRGPLEGIDPLVGPVFFSFQQAREDLALHTDGLSPDQLWVRPYGFGPVGFHIRHIGGSVDRLTTYLLEDRLSDAQLGALRLEMEPGQGREELLAALAEALAIGEERLRKVDLTRLTELRTVGRLHKPTTVIGLLVHIAEHTQRHVGQAIAAAKLARVWLK